MTNAIKQKTKYSGVEWFGNVPEDWQVKKLKFVFKYFTGGTPDSGKDKYYSDDGLNWITITDLDGKFTSESKNKITELAVEDKNMKIAPAGSLLYSFKLSVGQMAFVSKETYTNEAIFAILPDKDINLDFWYYALQSYLIENANENIYGAKIFNQPLIDNSILLVPPPSAQEQIGKYLDIKTKEIEKFIDDKKKLVSLLEEQKQNIIYKAITKGLKHNTETKKTNIKWLGNIPSEWKVVPLSKYFISKVDYRGKTPEKVDFSEKVLVTTRNIRDGKINYDKLEYITETAWSEARERGLPSIGDFVFTMEAPLGEVAIIDDDSVAFGQRIIKFKIDNKYFNRDYLLYLMRSYFFTYQLNTEATGSTALGLKASKIHGLKAILPPLDEQKEIVDYLNIETVNIDKAIHTVQQEIELIEEYKKSLIYQAVTGKMETLLTNK